MNKIVKLGVIVLVLGFQAASAVRHPPANTISLKNCDLQGLGRAKCGTYEVFENRATAVD